MFELSLNQIKKHMGTTLILDKLNFSVYENEKVGIVGANGSGKSTILKMIAGIEPLNLYPGSWSPGYDYGWISKPRTASVAYLDQLPEFEEGLTVKDILNLAFEEVFKLEKKLRSLEVDMQSLEGDALEKVLMKYSRVSEAFDAKNGYDIQEKFNKICTGLKLDKKFLNRKFHRLSGGEKSTVMLGKLLIDRPDILLLDEPTNHLDTDAIEWLEGYLKQYQGIVMIVSHDRYFLDAIVGKIIEIEDMGAITYKGNYSKYVETKKDNMRIQFENYKEQQKDIKAMKKSVQELRQWAMKADNNKFFKRAASIQIKLDKMNKISKPKFDRANMKINLSDTERSGKETIIAKDLSKSFGDVKLLDHANLMIRYGERVALLGKNGCGKSTFLKMLLGEEALGSGEVRLGANVKTAYLPQEIIFENEEHTVLECFREGLVITEGKGREFLSKFMFIGKTVFTKVNELSGGERTRLKLAKLLYHDVNLLILDEPTNHLDIGSIETLESALEPFEGTILFISHDRYFINKISERIVAIESCIFKEYDGDYNFYKEERKIEETPAFSKKKSVILKKPCKTPANYEDQIESLELKIQELDQEMKIYPDDYLKLEKLHNEKLNLDTSLQTIYEAWENAQE
ncbi:MAG: ABC-F family ATP-binding cassette domain-containing protein [Clostridiales bacterium]|nr:ABC-F family ATP-binding cassette domain-containing protein [Clostridiales bacterium]